MPRARTPIMFHEPPKPDIGQPTWTMNQRRRLIGGFLTFITCKDFDNRFKNKSGFRAEFWRALTHRTFAYGDAADAKITDTYARKEFFRLKSQYTTMNDAKNYDASAMGDLTAETLDDFEEIAKEGWAGEFGIADVGKDAVALHVQQPQQQQQDEDKEMTDPDVDEEKKSTVRGSPPGPFTPTATGATERNAALSGGAGPLPSQPGVDINAWLSQSNSGSGLLPSQASTTDTPPTEQTKVATANADDGPDSPAFPRRSVIFKAVTSAMHDKLLTESGKGNWIAILENPAMNQKWAICSLYNVMYASAATRNRMRWMKDRVKEWVEMEGEMDGDVEGSFVGGAFRANEG